jgi:hypothetical protein
MHGDIARYHAAGQIPVLARHSCLPALRLEVLCPFRFTLQVCHATLQKSRFELACFEKLIGPK